MLLPVPYTLTSTPRCSTAMLPWNILLKATPTALVAGAEMESKSAAALYIIVLWEVWFIHLELSQPTTDSHLKTDSRTDVLKLKNRLISRCKLRRTLHSNDAAFCRIHAYIQDRVKDSHKQEHIEQVCGSGFFYVIFVFSFFSALSIAPFYPPPAFLAVLCTSLF